MSCILWPNHLLLQYLSKSGHPLEVFDSMITTSTRKPKLRPDVPVPTRFSTIIISDLINLNTSQIVLLSPFVAYHPLCLLSHQEKKHGFYLAPLWKSRSLPKSQIFSSCQYTLSSSLFYIQKKPPSTPFVSTNPPAPINLHHHLPAGTPLPHLPSSHAYPLPSPPAPSLPPRQHRLYATA